MGRDHPVSFGEIMLRRNFLKLLGLIPFITVPKLATGGLIGKGPKVPVKIPEVSSKWYVIVSINNPDLLQKRLQEPSYSTELELSGDCNPRIGDIAYLMLDGTVGGVIQRTYKYPVHIGTFISKRYQKSNLNT